MAGQQARLGTRAGFGGMTAIAGAITLVLINESWLDFRLNIDVALAVFCGSLFVLLGGFVTALSTVLRADRQTYFIVIGTVLFVAAVGLSWFALTVDPLSSDDSRGCISAAPRC